MSFFADGVDAALEWSVGGSFSRVGVALRRRLERWTPLDGKPLVGRVIVISGATSGIGLEAARAFVAMGASVEIIARDERRAEATCAELRAQRGGGVVDFVLADTGDLTALRRAATELLRRHPAIDVLIHNAGALDDEYRTSPDGIERTVASQVVGPFLLTGLLLPALRAAPHAKVLWVSSGGMYSEPLSVDRLEMPADGYDGTIAYARAKRAQVTLAEAWAERLRPDGIAVRSMHPGWADTPGIARSLPRFRRALGPLLRSAADGADTLIWLAVDEAVPERETGGFWHDRRSRPLHRLASTRRSDTPAERERLWRWAVTRSGLVV